MIFRRKIPRKVGSGYYLLYSSITSILIIIILIIKFWELIFSQITNRTFLYVNCLLVDVSLKILLSASEWLNACVAIDRMTSVIKDVRFDTNKKMDYFNGIYISITITYIHDPMNRKLIDDIDIDEKRIWCFVQFSSFANIYNYIITIFHSVMPFTINITSAICIVLKISK